MLGTVDQRDNICRKQIELFYPSESSDWRDLVSTKHVLMRGVHNFTYRVTEIFAITFQRRFSAPAFYW